MIDQSTLITYLAILLGFVFIPGPAVVLTLTRATSSGVRVGMATSVGIAIGGLIHTAMAVLGLSAIIVTSAVMFNVIKYAGAAYLIYLGVRAILAKSDVDLASGAAAITAPQVMRQAILAEILNPKTAMFVLAFLPQFVKPENGAVTLQIAVLGLLLVAMGLCSTMTVAISAGSVGRFLRRHPAVMRWQGKIVGGIYCALGLRLALQER